MPSAEWACYFNRPRSSDSVEPVDDADAHDLDQPDEPGSLDPADVNARAVFEILIGVEHRLREIQLDTITVWEGGCVAALRRIGRIRKQLTAIELAVRGEDEG